MFESIIDSQLTLATVAICTGVSIGLGAIIAFVYGFRSAFSKNFLITLVLMPAIVQAVIMMVNGNIGMGVAVAGAFSLVRFRSVPGNSKDICFIFFAMSAGIASGIGQVYFALIITVAVCVAYIVLRFAVAKINVKVVEKELRIIVPEDFDFETELAPIFAEFALSCELTKIKTSNMGSTFSIYYKLKLKPSTKDKVLIDALRVKNSNLPISLSIAGIDKEEL